MSHEVIHNAEHYVKKRRRKSRLLKTLAVVACVVVFCTTYALILPAITSKTDIFCGLEEHVHTKDCYVQVSVQEPVLTCSLQSLNVHVHQPECMDSEGRLVCGLADYVAHAHNELCYDAEGNLVCTLEERDTHYHSEACYALPQGNAEEQPTVGHVHEEGCYTRVQGELSCQLPQESHSHSEACYTQGETILCTVIEEGHVHEAACYESVLSCELSESEGHVHSDDCYVWSEELTCGMEEEPATEGEQLSETQDDAFSAPNAHQVICGMAEAETHVHTEECFCAAEQALTCTLAEGESHSHTELCYGLWELTCEIEAHTHGEICYSNPEADVEKAADWEKTFSEVELTGDWQQDVLSIAKTQLGYSESTKNYTINENGVRKGYSRYGAWYGDPYGDWCAMFTSFCMRYAGVDGIPLNAACTPWIRQLKEMNLFRERGAYTPHSGDLIFYDWESDGLSDHVGFVSEYVEPTETEPAKIVALEGNSSDRVRYVEYQADDARIVGYGLLSRNRLHRVYCGIDEHTHDDACYNAEGVLTCTIEEHTHSDACNEYKLVYHNDALQVFVNIKGVSGLPADLSLSVTPVTRDDAATFDAMEVALSREMASKTEYVGAAAFYSLQLHSEGQPYELPEEATVSVDMSFAEPVFTPEEMEDSSGMRTYVLSPEPIEQAPQTEDTDSADTQSEQKPNKKGPSSADTDSQETSSESEQNDNAELPMESYDAQPAEAEVLVEPENGITGVSFRSGEIATVAFALTRQTVTGTFWERVDSTADIVSGGTYIIVSAEGNYALRGNTSTNYRAVTLETIKGNENYYLISGSENTDQRWTFTGSGTSYTIRNQGSSGVYLNMSNNNGLNTSSASVTLSYLSTENVWRFSQSVRNSIFSSTTYYLRNTGTGTAFSRGNSTDYTRNSVSFNYTRDMLIFKLSDVTSLEVPADVVKPNEGENGEEATAPEKPDYPAIVDPSGSKKGETSLTGTLDDKVVSVKGEYYSDPATSDIERGYQADSFAAHELNDGKVLTDKSVIYMGDDYGAFEHYDVNTFGVALSTMGQEYKVPYQDKVDTPIDMVFVLDASGSMTSNINGGNDDRASTMVKAVNAAIAKLMEGDANRVGIVLYSGGAWEMLPLGRYEAEDGQYLVTELRSNLKHDPMGTFEKSIRYVIGGPTLKDAVTKKSYANAGRDVQQGWGTYTQAGTALGKDVFAAIGDDTTYTTTVGEGEYEREVTVIRQPVMVLLSDGEPTYSTNIYMDPLNGPHYGDGGGVAQNAKGIHGFYTVLTANYCKRMIGIQYQKPALFYTVGMGITAPDAPDPDGPAVSTSETGDNYKRAVLNPTPEIIAALTSSDKNNVSTTVTQFRNLINENFNGQAVQTQSVWSETWTGVPHIYTPALPTNPYRDDYSYADGAYFDEEFSEEGLAQVFTDIIENSFQTSPYGFVLYKNSAIDIKDNVGYGMEIKGDPILRYNGTNYTMTSKSTVGSVTTYVYDYTHTDPYIPSRESDLSEITVRVVKNYDGTQSVILYVPDDVLPTYTPELIGKEYYYEALPVRLIYRVGLTEESEQKVLDLQETGGELSFYTNKWQSVDDVAISTLVPHENNPFYNDIPGDGLTPQYHEHHDKKDENTTGTRENATDCTMYIDSDTDHQMRIVHYLGNNGKLVFRAETTEIPVEKTWQDVNPDIMNPVTMELYLVSETTNEEDVVYRTGTFVKSLVLNAENEWKGVFEGVTIPEENSYYVVVEKPVSGYQAFYSGESVSFSVDNDTPITGVKVDFAEPNKGLVKVTNAPAVELPSTGGPGEMLYTLGGSLLIAAAGIALMYTRHGKRRKGDKAHS